MNRKLIILGLLLSLTFPSFAQRGPGNRGSGNQVRQRIHQPGTGQQAGTTVQKRDRKRDGTGVNCANGPCLQQQTQTQTRSETQTQAEARTQTQTATGTQAQTRTKQQTQTQSEIRTRTEQGKPSPKN